MDRDTFETVAKEEAAETKIERSRFLAFAFPLTTEEEFASALVSIEKRYFDATHHCWAFRLFDDGRVRSRSSDAGEPSGTAGKPILSAIEGADLFDVGVVVVRWYGGIKLGTGGLSRAYRESASELLGTVTRVRMYLYRTLVIEVPFASISSVYRILDPPHIKLASEEFGEPNRFGLQVRKSLVERLVSDLTERQISHRLEGSAIDSGNS